jgi:hypothetical protein
LQKDNRGWVVVIARLSGQGGYEIGRLKSKKTRRVTESDVAKLRKLIAEMGLLNAPSLEDRGDVVCMDGTTWGYELIANGEYHAFSRHCPIQPPEDRFCEFGRALLKLAKVSPDEVE